MFERYTEKARRVIFFARYEASQYGSPYIETEHLLLGLLREDRALADRFLRQQGPIESIRKEIEARITIRERITPSAEVPLTDECKKILHFAAEEADKLNHRHVGTEHLLLAMLRMESSLAALILRDRGLKLETLREELAKHSVAISDRIGPSIAARAISELQKRDPELRKEIDRFLELPKKALPRLESFLSGLKTHNPQQLLSFFASNAHFVDVNGKHWDPVDIHREFETLFAPYAKKNATYTIEQTLDVPDASAFFGEFRPVEVAIVLWKNAILASMERVWMHRMCVVLVLEGEEWAIALVQVTPVKPS